MFSSGSPPKKVSTSRLGAIASMRRSIHRRPRAAVSSDIFAACLVVVAVVPLDAVVAGEVALQRRQHGDLQRVGALAHLAEERAAARRARCSRLVDDEAVLGELCHRARSSRSSAVGAGVALRPGDRGDRSTSRLTMSCASVKVFIRNTSSRSASGTRTLNMDDCMRTPVPERDRSDSAWGRLVLGVARACPPNPARR